jgi:hypothetical protein
MQHKTVIATHVRGRSLTRRVHGVVHRLLMDNFFSPLQTYFMTCTQEVLSVVGQSDGIIKECQGSFTARR